MRNNTKQSLLDIVKTIYDAHDEIKKLLKKGDINTAGSLLGSCQDAVISIGDTIISSEGEECVTVSFIESYCRDLFDVYNSLSAEKDTDCNEVYKDLNRDLTDIKKSIDKDIKIRREVVFMPYKASMWDSLESVWKEAEADPDCDAYVVPIPYYDRKSDFSFGEFHYEGSEYPDYVPVVHYDNYDLEKRKPDSIYIHNPYDECNKVTSIDPRFYSKELIKYTKDLVYIPYFVLAEINPDDENALKALEDFVLYPVMFNADRIILQSENMKKAYIKIMLRTWGDTESNRKCLEERIKGTGSPKFEKVKNLSRDDYELPDEWKKIIYKSDGIRKKVVFYNTSLGAFCDNGEKVFDKMKSVLEIFYNNRDDIALLWRPHPLLRSTIDAISPEIICVYDGITDNYKTGGWGIYDDSADLDRAIAISDAYYGDQSSVVQLCKNVGMPIMIQNMDVN